MTQDALEVEVSVETAEGESKRDGDPATPRKSLSPRAMLERFPSESWRKEVFRFDESNPKVLKATKEMEAFTKRACLNKRNFHTTLVLYGPTGTGKSSLLNASVNFFNSIAVDLWYYSIWPHGSLSAVTVDSSYLCSITDSRFDEYLDDLAKCQLIGFDDIGAETDRYRSGIPAARLRAALERCKSKWVIISTNIPEPRWEAAFDSRVASRMRAGRIVSLDGVKDHRVSNYQKRETVSQNQEFDSRP